MTKFLKWFDVEERKKLNLHKIQKNVIDNHGSGYLGMAGCFSRGGTTSVHPEVHGEVLAVTTCHMIS